MKSYVIEELGRVAARQYGLVSSAQLRQHLSPSQVRRAVEGGRLRRVGTGVYALPGAPPAWRQRAMAACLAYGPPVALSRTAAARLWELDGVAGPTIEVTVPPTRSGRLPDVVTHRRALPPGDIVGYLGIPVTSVSRTIADLAGAIPVGALTRAVDDALSRRLVSADGLARDLAGRPRVNQPGMGQLRRLVGDRLAEPGLADSVWEDRLFHWLVDDGLPAPVRQHRVVIDGVPRSIDLAYPVEMVAVEFLGFRYHALGRHRFDADQDRTTDLALAGWLVVLVTSSSTRRGTVGRVARALRVRGAAGMRTPSPPTMLEG